MRKIFGNKKDSWTVKVFLGSGILLTTGVHLVLSPSDQKMIGFSTILIGVGALCLKTGLNEMTSREKVKK